MNDAEARKELKTRLEQAGYGVVSVRRSSVSGAVLRAFLAFSPDECPREANVIEWSPGSVRASMINGSNDGYVGSIELPEALPLTEGCAVQLTRDGVILKDVKRVGKKWTGTAVRFSWLIRDSMTVGQEVLFTASAVLNVVPPARLTKMEAALAAEAAEAAE